MAAPRKLFRIEQMGYDSRPAPAELPVVPLAPVPVPDADAAQRHSEVIAEIRSLRALIQPHDEEQKLDETYRARIAEFRKIKGELLIIHTAIDRTKPAIPPLPPPPLHTPDS